MTPMEEVENLLVAAIEETQYRTVASRAYFAAYNAVMRLAKLRGFEAEESADDHRRVISYLKLQNNDLIRRIGFTRLPRLRTLRNRADYVLDVRFERGLAEEAVETARQIIEWARSLTGE